ncbi:MAG: DUF4230 domain-containing protein [Synergistaceae bacterium]|nr:DUF4230 domain-containing protein [Synergistaceae bacterium]
MFLSIAVVLALAVSIGFNVWLFTRGKKPEAKKSIISIIQTKIKDANEMVTLRSYFQGIASDTETGKSLMGIHIPATGRKFLAVYSGEILCGCDLAKIEISERFDLNKIIVKIPHSTIMNITVNHNDIKVYHQDKGLFAQAYKLDDQNLVIASSIEEMRNKAVNEWNLLVRSDENAKRNLEAFISSLGMDAEIIFIEDVDVIEEENKELEAISINNNLEAVL